MDLQEGVELDDQSRYEVLTLLKHSWDQQANQELLDQLKVLFICFCNLSQGFLNEIKEELTSMLKTRHSIFSLDHKDQQLQEGCPDLHWDNIFVQEDLGSEPVSNHLVDLIR